MSKTIVHLRSGQRLVMHGELRNDAMDELQTSFARDTLEFFRLKGIESGSWLVANGKDVVAVEYKP